ncbi:MAG: response regulator [Betaproteobacteria bacterium]|nr:response regulator [Betaproteobacteria bacterium]
MPHQDPPLSREALLEVFCTETRERLSRALDSLQQGPDACDYDLVHQEFDSLHGGARAVDLPWLEHYSRVVAGYARFLRHLRRGGQHQETHLLLTRAVATLVEQCHKTPLAELATGMAPEMPMDDLLDTMQNLMRRTDPAELSPCAHRPAPGPLQILVVDDSSTSRLLFRIHLPPEGGHVVYEAEDAAGALRVALEIRPDVVFLDYNLPESDGVSIARTLRAAGLDPCCILLTANVQQAVLDEARAAGFAGVLEKPVSRDKIAAVLRAVAQG